MIEEMLAARGICVSYETVRQWSRKFGTQVFRSNPPKGPARADKRHLDENDVAQRILRVIGDPDPGNGDAAGVLRVGGAVRGAYPLVVRAVAQVLWNHDDGPSGWRELCKCEEIIYGAGRA